MADRVVLAEQFMAPNSCLFCHIDENEYENLFQLFNTLSMQNQGTIVWDKKNPVSGANTNTHAARIYYLPFQGNCKTLSTCWPRNDTQQGCCISKKVRWCHTGVPQGVQKLDKEQPRFEWYGTVLFRNWWWRKGLYKHSPGCPWASYGPEILPAVNSSCHRQTVSRSGKWIFGDPRIYAEVVSKRWDPFR